MSPRPPVRPVAQRRVSRVPQPRHARGEERTGAASWPAVPRPGAGRAPRADGTGGVRASDRPRPARRRALSAVLWTVVAVCGLAYGASLAVPLWFQLHHERLLVVTSGSMAPQFDAGDAVVLRQVQDPSELRVGQIVSFWPVGSTELVTHRIVSLARIPVPDTGGGTVEREYIVTRGDANAAPDPDATPVTRVRGVYLDMYPGWGWALEWAGSPAGRATMLVPPLLALGTLELLAVLDARREARADRRAREQAPDEWNVDEVLLGRARGPWPVA